MGGLVEFRNFGARLEVRDAGAGSRPRLTGYAAKFNTLSHPLGVMQFREKIDPRAFDETLASRPDVRFTFNHDPNHVMGRTGAGTLKLSADRVGLGFDLDVPNTEAGRDLVVSIRRGDISDCSFSFRTLDDAWSKDAAGNPIRTLKKVSLENGDVAAVTYPAYPDTQISARALEAVEQRGRALLGNITPASSWAERELELMKVKVERSTPLLYGYATVFHRYGANVSKRGLHDCLLRGTFTDSIERDLITANLVGHDKRVFASTADDSLKLIQDKTGLRFEIRPASAYRDEFNRIFEMVRRGKVREMSIERASHTDDEYCDSVKRVRYIHKARLYHVSPVVGGSFPGTSICAGFGSLESIAAGAARARELQLASIEG